MSTNFEVPLQPQPQQFSVQIGTVTYQLTVVWNFVAQCWVLDIADRSGNKIICGIALVPLLDLLDQFEYLNLGFRLYATSDFDPNAVPTFDNLGTTGHLYAVVA